VVAEIWISRTLLVEFSVGSCLDSTFKPLAMLVQFLPMVQYAMPPTKPAERSRLRSQLGPQKSSCRQDQ
jgi:hypothetical protein